MLIVMEWFGAGIEKQSARHELSLYRRNDEAYAMLQPFILRTAGVTTATRVFAAGLPRIAGPAAVCADDLCLHVGARL